MTVNVYSPAQAHPALWLDAGDLNIPEAGTESLTISEWPDASGNLRDGYQASPIDTPDRCPAKSTGLLFDGSAFLYLDDRSLSFTDFTALARFDAKNFGDQDQTIFQIAGLKIAVGGSQNPKAAESHLISYNGSEIVGAHLASNQPGRITTVRSGSQFSLGFHDGHFFPAQVTGAPSPLTFPTIGATRLLADSAATNHLDGSVEEIILFTEALEPGLLTRMEDYQQSRWDGVIVWDYRDDALALALSGANDHRNVINGGWGDDTLSGKTLDDTLRGGPGNDQLRGGDGADRFHILAAHGNDTLLDFSEEDGDVLDLSDIFGGHGGSPESFLKFRLEIVRGTDDIPRVFSFLDLDHNGDGSGVDQSIIFAEKSYSNDDLPRLVGQGSLLLGGPNYPTQINITSTTNSLTELEIPYPVTLTRSGNSAGALEVPISFTGIAELDTDYRVEGASGSGQVRLVHFAAGATTAQFSITPIVDTLSESETLNLTVMASPLVTNIPTQSLNLTLNDGPQLSIQTVRHATIEGPITGTVNLERTGNLSQPLTLELHLSGSAAYGVD